jgi:hypothetical protein
MGTNQRSHARLRFFTREETIVTDSETDNAILGVTTQKKLGDNTHSFVITLSPRIAKSQIIGLNTSYISGIIKPYDLVEISFKTGDEDYKVEMIGFVSSASISLEVDTQSGVPSRVFTVQGFGMARFLFNCKLFFNPYALYSNEEAFNGIGGGVYFFTEKAKHILNSKNVSEFIKNFLGLAFTNSFDGVNNSPFFSMIFGPRGLVTRKPGTTVKETQGLKIHNIVDMQGGITTQFTENKIMNPYFLTELSAGPVRSIWDIIFTYADPPFHECFIDLRKPQEYFYPTEDYGRVLSPTEGHGPLEHSESSSGEFIEQSLGRETKFVNNVLEVEKTHSLGAEPAFPPLVLYVRTTPFSPDTWNKLSYHVFNTSDIINSQLSTSEENIHNYYNLMCAHDSPFMGNMQLAALAASTMDSVLHRGRCPIYDTESILKYGIRPFPADTTKFVTFIYPNINGTHLEAKPNSIDVIKPLATLCRQLLRWHAYGEDFEAGTIVLKGRVGIGPTGASIGSRLIECTPEGSRTGKEFYIEGVTQNWTIGAPLVTQLTVTRGHFPYNYVDETDPQKIQDGRFKRVDNLCSQLRLSQNNFGNENLFFPVEPIDSNTSLRQ